MNEKTNLRIITKNHAVDLKIGSTLEIDFRADWTHESNPTAWEVTLFANMFHLCCDSYVILTNLPDFI